MFSRLFSRQPTQLPPTPDSRRIDLAFIVCIEKGFLEEQSLLLFESIRRFGGRYKGAPIYACSPRAGFGVSDATRSSMRALGVTYIEEPLNRDLAYFAYANKNFATAYIERNTRHDALVFLDSDTIFLREPSELARLSEYDALVRPVDSKGICSSGESDENDVYWRRLAEVTGVSLEKLPMTRTSVDGVPIRANYNGGFIAVNARLGVFNRWMHNILAIHHQQLKPKPDSFWGTGQSTLVMALYGTCEKIGLLPNSYNYPLHQAGLMSADNRIQHSKDVVHLHYHWMFEEKHWPAADINQPTFLWEEDRRRWLYEKVPFRETRPPNDHGIRQSGDDPIPR